MVHTSITLIREVHYSNSIHLDQSEVYDIWYHILYENTGPVVQYVFIPWWQDVLK